MVSLLVSLKFRNVILSAGFFRVLYALKKDKFLLATPCRGKQIIIRMPTTGTTYCMSVRQLGLRGIQFGLFMRTLSNLRRKGYLRYDWFSRKKIVVNFSLEGENLIMRIINEFPIDRLLKTDVTKTDIKLLKMISYYGFLPNARIICRKLRISRQGLSKMVRKHRDIGCIDNNGLLTRLGIIFLHLFEGFIGEFSKKIKQWRNSFNSLLFNQNIEHGGILESLVDIMDLYRIVVSHNQTLKFLPSSIKVDIVGIDDSPRIFAIVRIFKNLLVREGAQVDVVLVCLMNVGLRKMIEFECLEREKKVDLYADKKLSFLEGLFLNATESKVVLMLTNPKTSNILRDYLKERLHTKVKVIFIEKISRSAGLLEKNIENIVIKGKKLFGAIYRALKNKEKIKILWGSKGSNIELKPHKKIPSKDLNKAVEPMIGTLEGSLCTIPYGTLKIDLEMASKFCRVSGKIVLSSEPIYGVKCPEQKWFDYEGGTISLHEVTTSSNQVRIKGKADSHKALDYLRGAILKRVYVGLNSVSKENIKTIALTEPYLLRYVEGLVLIEMAVASPQNIRTYSYVGNNVRIMIGSRRVY